MSRYAYYNTNSIWLDLRALSTVLEKRRGVLGLPMIRNRKTVDPRVPDSPRLYQLETAMGSAIEVFNGAQALRVPPDPLCPGEDHQRSLGGALRRHGDHLGPADGAPPPTHLAGAPGGGPGSPLLQADR